MSDLLPSTQVPALLEHPEMIAMQRQVMIMYEKQRADLMGKPTVYLEELLHRSEDRRLDHTFTVRTAAEINRAACTLLLEERRA